MRRTLPRWILALNHKPTAQVQSELLLAAGLGPLLGPDQARNYINFYAYMHKVVDEHIGSVLDAINRWRLPARLPASASRVEKRCGLRALRQGSVRTACPVSVRRSQLPPFPA